MRANRETYPENVFEILGNGWEWFGKKIFAFLGKRGLYDNRKTLETPENTEFLGGVVAGWLQKCVINLLSE